MITPQHMRAQVNFVNNTIRGLHLLSHRTCFIKRIRFRRVLMVTTRRRRIQATMSFLTIAIFNRVLVATMTRSLITSGNLTSTINRSIFRVLLRRCTFDRRVHNIKTHRGNTRLIKAFSRFLAAPNTNIGQLRTGQPIFRRTLHHLTHVVS